MQNEQLLVHQLYQMLLLLKGVIMEYQEAMSDKLDSIREGMRFETGNRANIMKRIVVSYFVVGCPTVPGVGVGVGWV